MPDQTIDASTLSGFITYLYQRALNESQKMAENESMVFGIPPLELVAKFNFLRDAGSQRDAAGFLSKLSDASVYSKNNPKQKAEMLKTFARVNTKTITATLKSLILASPALLKWDDAAKESFLKNLITEPEKAYRILCDQIKLMEEPNKTTFLTFLKLEKILLQTKVHDTSTSEMRFTSEGDFSAGGLPAGFPTMWTMLGLANEQIVISSSLQKKPQVYDLLTNAIMSPNWETKGTFEFLDQTQTVERFLFIQRENPKNPASSLEKKRPAAFSSEARSAIIQKIAENLSSGTGFLRNDLFSNTSAATPKRTNALLTKLESNQPLGNDAANSPDSADYILALKEVLRQSPPLVSWTEAEVKTLEDIMIAEIDGYKQPNPEISFLEKQNYLYVKTFDKIKNLDGSERKDIENLFKILHTVMHESEPNENANPANAFNHLYNIMFTLGFTYREIERISDLSRSNPNEENFLQRFAREIYNDPQLVFKDPLIESKPSNSTASSLPSTPRSADSKENKENQFRLNNVGEKPILDWGTSEKNSVMNDLEKDQKYAYMNLINKIDRLVDPQKHEMLNALEQLKKFLAANPEPTPENFAPIWRMLGFDKTEIEKINKSNFPKLLKRALSNMQPNSLGFLNQIYDVNTRSNLLTLITHKLEAEKNESRSSDKTRAMQDTFLRYDLLRVTIGTVTENVKTLVAKLEQHESTSTLTAAKPVDYSLALKEILAKSPPILKWNATEKEAFLAKLKNQQIPFGQKQAAAYEMLLKKFEHLPQSDKTDLQNLFKILHQVMNASLENKGDVANFFGGFNVMMNMLGFNTAEMQEINKLNKFNTQPIESKEALKSAQPENYNFMQRLATAIHKADPLVLKSTGADTIDKIHENIDALQNQIGSHVSDDAIFADKHTALSSTESHKEAPKLQRRMPVNKKDMIAAARKAKDAGPK